MSEWDAAKNTANLAKHGVNFETAARIFEGRIVTTPDIRQAYGELRQISIGQVDGDTILTVVHTDRQGRLRIISARKASRRERDRYEQALRPADYAG